MTWWWKQDLSSLLLHVCSDNRGWSKWQEEVNLNCISQLSVAVSCLNALQLWQILDKKWETIRYYLLPAWILSRCSDVTWLLFLLSSWKPMGRLCWITNDAVILLRTAFLSQAVPKSGPATVWPVNIKSSIFWNNFTNINFSHTIMQVWLC